MGRPASQRNFLNGYSAQRPSDASIQVGLPDGDSIHILRLHGYMFFGTVVKVVESVNVRLQKSRDDPTLPALDYLIVDMALVTNVDATAIQQLEKLAIQLAVEEKFIVCFCASPENAYHYLSQIQAQVKMEPGVIESFKLFPCTDTALEWCE